MPILAIDRLISAGIECGLSRSQLKRIVDSPSSLDVDYGVFTPSVSRFAKAGDPDDCGHHTPGPKGGKFTPGNTCASGSSGTPFKSLSSKNKEQVIQSKAYSKLDKHASQYAWYKDKKGNWQAAGSEPFEDKPKEKTKKEKKIELAEKALGVVAEAAKEIIEDKKPEEKPKEEEKKPLDANLVASLLNQYVHGKNKDAIHGLIKTDDTPGWEGRVSEDSIELKDYVDFSNEQKIEISKSEEFNHLTLPPGSYKWHKKKGEWFTGGLTEYGKALKEKHSKPADYDTFPDSVKKEIHEDVDPKIKEMNEAIQQVNHEHDFNLPPHTFEDFQYKQNSKGKWEVSGFSSVGLKKNEENNLKQKEKPKEPEQKEKPKEPVAPSGKFLEETPDGFVNYNNKSHNKAESKYDHEDNFQSSNYLHYVHNDKKFTSDLKNFSGTSLTGLVDYTKSSVPFNNHLRKGEFITQDNKEKMEAFSEALQKCSLPENMVFYRASRTLNTLMKNHPGFDLSHPENLVGAIINDKGFLSTSLSKNKAEIFYSSSGAFFEIKAPKGSHAVTTNKKGAHRGELEFIFDKDQNIEITGYKKDSKGRLVFEGKMIPKSEADKKKSSYDPGTTPEKKSLLSSSGFPTGIGSMKNVKSLGGSSNAQLVEDPDTKSKFVVKPVKSKEHAKDELLSDDIYNMFSDSMHTKAPKSQLMDGSKVSKFVKGDELGKLKSTDPKAYDAAVKKIRSGFALDALLANWDVVGLNYDNILVDDNGDVHRIDNGGALRYRGMGGPKGDKFGDIASEIDSMRDPERKSTAAKVFSGVTDSEIKDQVDKLWEKRWDLIEKIDAGDQGLSETIYKRLKYLHERFK